MIKVKERDLIGIIESIYKACDSGVITDTLWVANSTPYIHCEESVVEFVCNLLGLSFVDDYEPLKKLIIENNRNINIEVNEIDLIIIVESIKEGCNDGTIVDTLFYNDGKIENGIGGTTLVEFICCDLLQIPVDEFESYKKIIEFRK